MDRKQKVCRAAACATLGVVVVWLYQASHPTSRESHAALSASTAAASVEASSPLAVAPAPGARQHAPIAHPTVHRHAGDELLRQLDPLDALTRLDAMVNADAAFLFDAYSAVLEPGLRSGAREPIRRLLETIPRPDVAQMLIASFANVWARTDPAETAAWIATLPSQPDRTRVLGEVLSTWAAQAAAPAAAFAAALPPGEMRRTALRHVVAQWRTADLPAVTAWLLHAEAHPDFEYAVATLAPDPAPASATVASTP